MNQSANNPYDFIMNDKKPAKRSFGGGGSKKDRILIAVAGGVVLVAVIAIVAAILSSTGKDSGTDLLTVAQKQTELIRISAIGEKKARGSVALNFATTAGATIETDQITTLTELKRAHIKPDPKTLALGKNSKTDVLLTTAEQNNQFDEVFTQEMTTELTAYQAALQKAYDSASSTRTKAEIKQQFDHISTLIPPTTNKTN